MTYTETPNQQVGKIRSAAGGRKRVAGLALVVLLFSLMASPAAAYQTASRTSAICTVNIGWGVNWAGQDQAALSSGDPGCKFVQSVLRKDGSFKAQKSDSSQYFSAVATHSNANQAYWNVQSNNGTWGGWGPYTGF